MNVPVVHPHTPAMSITWREKLQKIMDDRNVTQYALAKATGLRQSRISLWVGGRGEPSLDEWGLLCRALDVPISTFLPEHLASAVPDYRTEEEQMLVRVARKVGVQGIWELVAEAAIHGRGGKPSGGPESPPMPGPTPGPRSPGPIAPIREMTRRADDLPPAPAPEKDDGGKRKPPKREK